MHAQPQTSCLSATNQLMRFLATVGYVGPLRSQGRCVIAARSAEGSPPTQGESCAPSFVPFGSAGDPRPTPEPRSDRVHTSSAGAAFARSRDAQRRSSGTCSGQGTIEVSRALPRSYPWAVLRTLCLLLCCLLVVSIRHPQINISVGLTSPAPDSNA